jgi:hypothetical protein
MLVTNSLTIFTANSLIVLSQFFPSSRHTHVGISNANGEESTLRRDDFSAEIIGTDLICANRVES